MTEMASKPMSLSAIHKIILMSSGSFVGIDFLFWLLLSVPNNTITGGVCEAWWIVLMNFILLFVIMIALIMSNPE